jgi:fructokinase
VSLRFGIDLGGTKIELIALDDGAVRLQRRVPTPAHDYEAILDSITELIASAERELRARGSVGVGMPGAISRHTGAIKNANTQVLNGRALDRDLSGKLGREVRVQNDANCFALSEATDGAGRNAEVVFGVILGTGVGGGIVVHKTCLTGRNAIAGEWGHNPLPAPSAADLPLPACYCGRSGCIETYLAGPSLQRDHARAGGADLPAHEIARRAAHGDVQAEAALERYCERLARALASVVNILDPDAIVLGGGLSQIGRLYERVPELWARYIFSDRVETALVQAEHGDSSGVRGAAWLWPPT